MSAIQSIRILMKIDWPGGSVDRLWDGSGPYVDSDGEVWIGCAAMSGLEDIELALNGEAYTLEVALSGVDSETGDLVWLYLSNDGIIGAVVRLMIQPCDEWDQAIGAPEVKFTGIIDNITFDDRTSKDGITSILTVEVVNRFTMRRVTHGAVYSDTDQRARSAVLNPTAPPDRICERVPMLLEKTINWPKYN